ncbi:nitronate monooxygenase [Moraxella nasovis]|uniref:nitronate monooxygenase n=1 Tax=Moraxella nasovis TaxID=2904121 RepID=UPI001F603B1B|nr:nitronate monooxygenase [Moraxella nasovis]UNU73724.1 nitronate monooxygenase [Moraxella nasovis]
MQQINISIKQHLKLATPIMQAPMAKASNASFVAAASTAGALGSLGAGMMPPKLMISEISAIKTLTNQPFAVNLMVLRDHQTQKFTHAMPDWLIQKYALLGVNPNLGAKPALDFKEQFQVLIDHPVPVASFTFGILTHDEVAKLKQVGTLVIGTANHCDEVVLWQQMGGRCGRGARQTSGRTPRWLAV